MTLLKNWMEKLVLLQYYYILFIIQSATFYLLFVQAFQNWVDVSEGFYREIFHFEMSKKRFENFRKF